MKRLLFQSNINHLIKVNNKLNYQQKMNSKQVILCKENQDKVIEATVVINQAIRILRGIE